MDKELFARWHRMLNQSQMFAAKGQPDEALTRAQTALHEMREVFDGHGEPTSELTDLRAWAEAAVAEYQQLLANWRGQTAKRKQSFERRALAKPGIN